MQDRFKFRAWNLEKGIMHYDVEDTYDGISNNAIEHSNFSAVLEDNEYIVMQCTGLKDKNGKLIYEGDILFWEDENDRGYVQWQDEDADYLIIFSNYSAVSFNLEVEPSQLEIIGNIYENKELLKEQNNGK